MAGEPRKPRIRPRRIIERQRLKSALDRSEARVRLLVAPAGYGKTTLAEQWAGQAEDRLVSWFRARRSAADVTVVARALVAAADVVLPGAGRRLLQRLAVTDDPEREAVLLAEMLAEDLETWPPHGWIAVDEYEHLAASAASEVFVETVVSGSPVQLLIAGTVRPSWVAPREILAGSVLTVPEAALSLTGNEAVDVLDGAHDGLAAGLVALTGGWPTVIGLAAMTRDAGIPEAELPESLFDFYAEELYRGLDPVVRTGLTILAEMPLIDRELATAILGADRATTVCDEALRLGIFVERAGYLDFDPLLASLFERLGRSDPIQSTREYLPRAGVHYESRGELDAAFELAERSAPPREVDKFVSQSMDRLLDGSRLPTLERWVSRAASRTGETSTMLLAQAEIALRQGHHLSAQALAERAARRGDPLLDYRAHLVSARAAHVGGREEEALAHFRSAEALAPDDRERRRVAWGQLTAAIDLEMDASHELLHELEGSVGEELDATEMVQAVDKRLLLGLRFGAIGSLARARQVSELLPAVEDPVVRCSFGSSFSCALNLAADYRRALEVATAMVDDANEYRVDFATPYGYLMQGAALAGLRRFGEAHEALSESQAAATRCGDSFGEQAVYAGRVRALLHEGRIREACALEPPDLTGAFPAMRGEVWASRGLALACMGRVVEAKTYAVEVLGKTKAIEPNILALAIAAVSGLKLRDSELTSLLRGFVQASVSGGAVDFVVTTYRANPDILAALLRDTETAEQTGFIVSRADDRPLVEGIGIDPLAVVDPVSTLTSRERDVYDLLCEGLSNAEIGRRLFISSPTVKVHVRHVYDKLGIRSRTAVALHAASRRAQENPTARGGDSGSSDTEG